MKTTATNNGKALSNAESRRAWITREEAKSLSVAYDAGVSAGKRGAIGGIVVAALSAFTVGLLVGAVWGVMSQ